MTHDFAMLCTIAKKVLTQENDEGASVLPARDVPPSPAKQEFRAKYQGRKRAYARKLEKLITDCQGLNTDRVAIAHGLIWFEDGGVGRLHHTPRSLKSNNPPVDADHIASKADRACSLRAEMDRLLPFDPFCD
jgi:hypothetical protein